MKKITTMEELKRLANLRRSVIWERRPGVEWPAPAAWVLNMSATRVDDLLRFGLEVYEPKHERRAR